MTRTKKDTLRLVLIGSATCLMALAATQAYAIDDKAQQTPAEGRIWIEAKTAVSEGSPVIQRDELPNLLIPLTEKPEVERGETEQLIIRGVYKKDGDLRNFDLIEDNPLFIGAKKNPEFDTLEARRAQASYSTSLNVDPLIPVAGAGLITSF